MITLKDLFDKLHPKVRLFLDIFILVYFMAIPILFYTSFLNISSKNFLSDFGLKISTFLYIFLLIFISLNILKYYSLRLTTFEKCKNFFKKVNFWTIFTISLVFTFLLLSFFIYNTYTSYPLPIEGYLGFKNSEASELLNKNLLNPIMIKCANERGERDFIINKRLICELSLNYSEGYGAYLNKIETTYFYKNNSQSPKGFTMDKSQIQNLSQYWNFDIDIDENYEQSLTRFYFVNNSGDLKHTNDLWLIPSRIISESAYHAKKERSFLLFMTVISILIFSTIGSIKNLRDIYHNK